MLRRKQMRIHSPRIEALDDAVTLVEHSEFPAPEGFSGNPEPWPTHLS